MVRDTRGAPDFGADTGVSLRPELLVDLVPGFHRGRSHYNGKAAERARAVWPWGRNAKVRTGCDKEFS
jgi:hypothetical protein